MARQDRSDLELIEAVLFGWQRLGRFGAMRNVADVSGRDRVAMQAGRSVDGNV